MTRNELNAAMEVYNEAGRVFDAAAATYQAALDHFRAIPGTASKADYATFAAAQTAFNEAKRVETAAYIIMSDLPEVASDDIVDGDDSAETIYNEQEPRG